jgi:hypothetical protein
MMLMLIKAVLAALLTLHVQRGKVLQLPAYASDSTTYVDRIDYYVDGQFVGTVRGSKSTVPKVTVKYTLPWKAPKKRGSYTLKITAVDAAGNLASSYATIVVQ